MCPINVNTASAEKEAARISGAAQYFTGETLSSQDEISTITANSNSKTAFSSSQDALSMLGQALDRDAENIRILGDAFEEFDAMMELLNAQGVINGK